MLNKNHKSVSVRMALALVLIAGVFGVMPARASADIKQDVSGTGFLNEDGTLRLGGNTPVSFQADNWDVLLDPERGPIFSPKNREALSPLTATTAGNWSALGSNLAGTDGALIMPDPLSASSQVDVIAVSGTNIYVGGCFQNAGGDPTADYIAKWDGTSWSGIGNDGAATPDGALKSCIRALVVDGTNIYVGGRPDAWNNGAPASQALYAAKWNGTSWSGLGLSFDNQVTSIVINSNNIYVGGYFTGFIRKWDGTSWSTLGGSGALSGGGVETMQLINSDLYVGGNFTAVFNGLNIVPEAAYIAKWDTLTENWSALGSNGDLPGGSINNSVNGLGTDGSNLYVAGGFTDVNNNSTVLTAADYIAKWDGTNWSALGSNGAGNGALGLGSIAIQTKGTDLYVGGTFTNVNNNGAVLNAADYIAKWDGTNWSALGDNGSGNGSLNHRVFTLGSLGDELLVGGDFTNVNNNGTVLNTADYIAAYEYQDTVAPVVNSVTRANANPTTAASVDFTVTFSEPVTGVNTGDFTLTTSGVSGTSVGAVSGSGDVYTVSVNTGSGSGTIRLDVVDDDSITDVAFNPLGGAGSANGNYTTGEVYTVPNIVTLNLKSIAANDGWVLESSETSNIGGTLDTKTNTFNLGDDKANKQYLGILHFDTSSLPDTAVITSVTLKTQKQGVSGTDPFTTHGGLLVDIQKPYFGTTASLVVGDFQATASQPTVATFNPLPVSNWYSASMNGIGINLTGTTQFRLRFTLDDNNDKGADYIKFYSGDATAANRPQLIIQYYIP